MAILLLLHINAQHFNCRLLQEDTLWTRLIYLIIDMIFDDSIIFVQVLMVQLQIGVQQVGHCEYKHHMYTDIHVCMHIQAHHTNLKYKQYKELVTYSKTTTTQITICTYKLVCVCKIK